VADAGKSRTVTIATNMAGRGTDIKLSQEVRVAGGLAIVGTERHESRRVDRQLRGRAGRQGDPGSSQFFVSLEDDLMRLFGSDRIAGLMDRIGIEEGEVIQAPMISRAIERAQKKVEENNFGIRKRLLEYDDVMNAQREVIYKRRHHALFGERLSVDISNIIYDVCDSMVSTYHHDNDYAEFELETIKHLSIEPPVSAEEFRELKTNEIIEKTYEHAWETYRRKNINIAKQSFPVIKDVYEKQGGVYENIVVPISDGLKVYQIITNLKKSYETQGQELVRSYEKAAVLMTIDDAWREHLREMDDLKQSVQNATYEQKDPLLIYKFESCEFLRTMVEKINSDVVSMLIKGHIPSTDPATVRQAQTPRKLDLSRMEMSKSEITSSINRGGQQMQDTREQQRVQPVRVEKKVGRNEMCPCGSGKKFKNCHGVGRE
jgi:preprotein translocase subunit SecA